MQDTARAFCAAQLSDYKAPETMDLIAEPLPRSANGKVMKSYCGERLAQVPSHVAVQSQLRADANNFTSTA